MLHSSALIKKRSAISTIVGGFFFLIIMVGAFTALILAFQFQFDLFDIGREVSNQEILKLQEDFSVKACVDNTNNNRLFVEVENLGSNHVEIVDLWIVNKSVSNFPAKLINVTYRDALIPFGFGASILENQPLFMNEGTYDIKLVSVLGMMQKFNGSNGLTVSPPIQLPLVFVSVGSGGVDDPSGLVFGPDGNLYVSSKEFDDDGDEDDTDVGNGVVLRYNGTTGAFIDVFASGGGLEHPESITFGPDGNLYVSSQDSDQVLRYNGTTGAFIDVFASGGQGAGLKEPTGLLFGPDGDLYVSNKATNRIWRYDGTTGAFIDVFASAGISHPAGLLAVGPDGFLYASSQRNDKVIRYDFATGDHTDFVSSKSGGLDNPDGLTFGSDGNLYVSSQDSDQVLRYDGTTGAFIDAFTCGQVLDDPAGIVFGADGNLYVSSQDSDEIIRFPGSGNCGNGGSDGTGSDFKCP